MPPTTSYSRGDVVLVSFPFTDLTSTKRRPALVISPDAVNRMDEDLILVAITSQLNPFPNSIQVLPTECEDGALPKESMIKLNKMFTLTTALITKKLCCVNDQKLNQVLASLRALFS